MAANARSRVSLASVTLMAIWSSFLPATSTVYVVYMACVASMVSMVSSSHPDPVGSSMLDGPSGPSGPSGPQGGSCLGDSLYIFVSLGGFRECDGEIDAEGFGFTVWEGELWGNEGCRGGELKELKELKKSKESKESKELKESKEDENLQEKNLQEKVITDSSTTLNYASTSSGAIVLSQSSSSKGMKNILSDDKDGYALTPCGEDKWVVLGLSEDIEITTVILAHYEKFSSTTNQFKVQGSLKYPTRDWVTLGSYNATISHGEQGFGVEKKTLTRYVKISFVSHHGSEHYCTVSQVKIQGRRLHEFLEGELVDSNRELGEMMKIVDIDGDNVDKDHKESGDAYQTDQQGDQQGEAGGSFDEGDKEIVKSNEQSGQSDHENDENDVGNNVVDANSQERDLAHDANVDLRSKTGTEENDGEAKASDSSLYSGSGKVETEAVDEGGGKGTNYNATPIEADDDAVQDKEEAATVDAQSNHDLDAGGGEIDVQGQAGDDHRVDGGARIGDGNGAVNAVEGGGVEIPSSAHDLVDGTEAGNDFDEGSSRALLAEEGETVEDAPKKAEPSIAEAVRKVWEGIKNYSPDNATGSDGDQRENNGDNRGKGKDAKGKDVKRDKATEIVNDKIEPVVDSDADVVPNSAATNSSPSPSEKLHQGDVGVGGGISGNNDVGEARESSQSSKVAGGKIRSGVNERRGGKRDESKGKDGQIDRSDNVKSIDDQVDIVNKSDSIPSAKLNSQSSKQSLKSLQPEPPASASSSSSSSSAAAAAAEAIDSGGAAVDVKGGEGKGKDRDVGRDKLKDAAGKDKVSTGSVVSAPPSPSSSSSAKVSGENGGNSTSVNATSPSPTQVPNSQTASAGTVAFRSCLEKLNYADFRHKMLNKTTFLLNNPSSYLSASSGSSAGGEGVENIFKTLMNEIKGLQLNLSIVDKYIVKMQHCYAEVIRGVEVETREEIKLVNDRVDALLASIKKSEEGSESDDDIIIDDEHGGVSLGADDILQLLKATISFLIGLRAPFSSLISSLASLLSIPPYASLQASDFENFERYFREQYGGCMWFVAGIIAGGVLVGIWRGNNKKTL